MPCLPRPRHASQFSTELPSCAFLDIAFLHSSYLLRTSNSTTVVPETIPITGTSVAHEASLPHANARHLALHGRCGFRSYLFLGDVELKVVGSPGCPNLLNSLLFSTAVGRIHREMVLIKSCFWFLDLRIRRRNLLSQCCSELLSSFCPPSRCL